MLASIYQMSGSAIPTDERSLENARRAAYRVGQRGLTSTSCFISEHIIIIIHYYDFIILDSSLLFHSKVKIHPFHAIIDL